MHPDLHLPWPDTVTVFLNEKHLKEDLYQAFLPFASSTSVGVDSKLHLFFSVGLPQGVRAVKSNLLDTYHSG